MKSTQEIHSKVLDSPQLDSSPQATKFSNRENLALAGDKSIVGTQNGHSDLPEREGILERTTTVDSQCEVPLSATPYKQGRRWFGLAVISLLNFMSAWSVVTYAPVADITRQHFQLSNLSPINWLYISSAFIYVAVSPASYLITRRSTKAALILSAFVLVLGSWLRYLGARLVSYPLLLVGQILCGASQPFALNIPSHYSSLWFPPRSRITATALMSLANPLGQAIGTLVVPFLATSPDTVSNMSLYVAILFTATVWAAVVTPERPQIHVVENAVHDSESITTSCKRLLRLREFYYLLVPFAIYVAAFNAFASLTQQLIQPYGYSDVQAGIIGAATIVVGLLASGISAPILDKTGAYKWPIRVCVVASTICYLVMIFAIRPYTVHGFVSIIVLAAIIGAASLILLPVVLELATDVSRPIPPELASSVLWTGGQGLGGVFILSMDKLRTADHKYTRSMIFLIVLTTVAVPFALALTQSRKVQECRPQSSGGGTGSAHVVYDSVATNA
ncbi:putative Cell surface receptor/MFS transporter [Taphrina deformans PYCC 5710]|uniref:Cell surface receptor/MFS transporter n=1 Tax=Taphrina deformans (strain PYCC 5710 / ATCC 11124 / CBS 356.35 / IMI 108563 / JCM 9778 / NBRC 8474) TaxID=1097556 RepID=R4X9R6_TAPDE|nr:putative Cell surface receptor/MFS transporter [Taphrina deformans PYCC 5710]|eukprot:CCG82475.1 putative Cell surface receptor/MFS transporter [Taphrina deformans PYCC 5710]